MLLFFFFKQKTAYEIMPSLVGSEMCIRDSQLHRGQPATHLVVGRERDRGLPEHEHRPAVRAVHQAGGRTNRGGVGAPQRRRTGRAPASGLDAGQWGRGRTCSSASVSLPSTSPEAADSPVRPGPRPLSLIHISEPTRLGMISYAVFCLK